MPISKVGVNPYALAMTKPIIPKVEDPYKVVTPEMTQAYIKSLTTPTAIPTPTGLGDIFTGIKEKKGIGSKILAGLTKALEFAGTSTGQKIFAGLQEDPYKARAYLKEAETQEQREAQQKTLEQQMEMERRKGISELIREKAKSEAERGTELLKEKERLAAEEPTKALQRKLMELEIGKIPEEEKRKKTEIELKEKEAKETARKPLFETIDTAQRMGDLSTTDATLIKNNSDKYKLTGGGKKIGWFRFGRTNIEEGKLHIDGKGNKAYVFSDGSYNEVK